MYRSPKTLTSIDDGKQIHGPVITPDMRDKLVTPVWLYNWCVIYRSKFEVNNIMTFFMQKKLIKQFTIVKNMNVKTVFLYTCPLPPWSTFCFFHIKWKEWFRNISGQMSVKWVAMFKTTAKFTPKPQQISRIFWFFKKGVIKHFAKSTGKKLKDLYLYSKRGTDTYVFHWILCKFFWKEPILKNICGQIHFRNLLATVHKSFNSVYFHFMVSFNYCLMWLK